MTNLDRLNTSLIKWQTIKIGIFLHFILERTISYVILLKGDKSGRSIKENSRL